MARPEIAIRDWLKALGVMTAGNMNQREAEARLAAYAPLIAHEFSPGAFSQASLAAVARQCKFFPSFAEVCEHLAAWVREHRPRATEATQIAALGGPALSDTDLAWIAFWHRRLAEIDANPAWNGSDPTQSPRAKLASLVRSQSPAAWRALGGAEPEAGTPSEAALAAVSAAVASVRASSAPPLGAAAETAPKPIPRPAPVPAGRLAEMRMEIGIKPLPQATPPSHTPQNGAGKGAGPALASKTMGDSGPDWTIPSDAPGAF